MLIYTRIKRAVVIENNVASTHLMLNTIRMLTEYWTRRKSSKSTLKYQSFLRFDWLRVITRMFQHNVQ